MRTPVGDVQSASGTRIGITPVESKLQTLIPDGAVSLEPILRTEELLERAPRPPDYERRIFALKTTSAMHRS
jgi:hypothetical protein